MAFIEISPTVIVGGGSGTVTVDSELSTTSENPVQNKAVKTALDGIQTDLTETQTEIETVKANLKWITLD